MSKPAKAVLLLTRLAVFGGILACAPMAWAQVNFSSLDRWRGLSAQRGSVTRSTASAPSAEAGRSASSGNVYHESEKEKEAERKYAERMVASIREKLCRPSREASVTWSETTVSVDATAGYFETPPTPAGVFAAVAARAGGTRATSITALALKRTAAILSKTTGQSEETAAFLASEAAASMEGGNLRVRVDDAAFAWNDRRQEQFRALLQEAGEDFKDIEFAKNRSVWTDNEIVRIDRAVQTGTLSADKAQSEKRQLSNTLEAALKRGSDAQRKIHDLPQKIRYVLD
jgi:hypothetical protein